MKKLILIFLILSSMTLALDKVVFTAGDWEPFASSKNRDARLGMDIIEEAYNEVGVKVEWKFFPWKRAFELAKTGEFSGTVLWLPNDERAKDFLFSGESIVVTKTVFFHRKDVDFDWNELSDLRKYKVAGTIGYAQSDALIAAGVNVELGNSDEVSFKKLIANRVEVFPAAFVVGYTIMKNIFTPEQLHMITNHSKPMETAPMHILSGKKNPQAREILDLYDKGLRMLKASGKYDEMVNKALGL
jgi:polar amino acid transport system substrate-binding protein